LVAVATLPTGEQCGVTGASGSVAGSVTSVQLTCAVPTLQLVAGALGGSGNVDGDRTTARFHSPQDVVPDAAGNLYSSVDIPGRHRWGRALLHACQSVCRCDRQLATFTAPFALALDSENNLFITDGNAIRKLSAAGIVSTVAGSQGPGSSDGSRSAAHFNGPAGIAVGPAGSLFIADTKNHTIRKISSDGIVTTIAGSAEKFGVTLGPLPTTLNAPFGLTYIGSTLYVTDAAENSLLAITSQF
jgi:DNA-binding beta-propeller fold protein YncE